MYCSVNGNHLSVYEDGEKFVRIFTFRSPVESACMNGEDKVVATYTDVGNNTHPLYTELYETSGHLIRKTHCS